MNERMIRVGGLELAAQSFGDANRPPILLIMGAISSMLWWPEALCENLASQGRYVIRYDNRDTGHSTKYPPGKPGYTFDDMVDDVFRVLDGYAIPGAHIVGMSLGAMIGQVAALKHPSRILSLTAISSSPVGMDTSHLPQFSDAFMARMEAAEEVDWSDRSQAIACMVEDSRVLAGTAGAFEEAEVRAFVERDYDRAGGYLSATNHGSLKIGDAWRGRLHEMKPPLLVIHGTADPVFPIEHGAALAAAVAGASLVARRRRSRAASRTLGHDHHRDRHAHGAMTLGLRHRSCYVTAGVVGRRLRRRGAGAAVVSGFSFTRRRRPSD